VIGVLALALSILLPALGRARIAGRGTGSAANLHTLSQVMEVYSATYAGAYPCTAEGRLYPMGCKGISLGFGYWDVRTFWPVVMTDFLQWEDAVATYVSPNARERIDASTCGWPTSYAYSNSFVGDPSLWSGSAAPQEALRRATFTHQVLFTSEKVLLWDREPPVRADAVASAYSGVDLAVSTFVAFVDGHVAAHSPADASPAIQNPLLPPPYGAMRLHNTLSGVRGADYR
jgi:hypothetical protein